ncbi:hypothetical protein GCM10015535_42320 [Streptomyces gelaticus]|uniref:Uncharacterized protein n=1 Tax=Streptomyces gelaticus TaxID=285446 RepID=A0ABQ2W4K4_9ACTN|nr:hypothetical protein GCM10015535_42320 [Streptomyces gelaticus]
MGTPVADLDHAHALGAQRLEDRRGGQRSSHSFPFQPEVYEALRRPLPGKPLFVPPSIDSTASTHDSGLRRMLSAFDTLYFVPFAAFRLHERRVAVTSGS